VWWSCSTQANSESSLAVGDIRRLGLGCTHHDRTLFHARETEPASRPIAFSLIGMLLIGLASPVPGCAADGQIAVFDMGLDAHQGPNVGKWDHRPTHAGR
jgi:hypothetical protein